jgi:hypothetical protein
VSVDPSMYRSMIGSWLQSGKWTSRSSSNNSHSTEIEWVRIHRDRISVRPTLFEFKIVAFAFVLKKVLARKAIKLTNSKVKDKDKKSRF